MSNVALNKKATASRFVAPFTPDRAVNGDLGPISRWVGNVPGWISIDLGAQKWINRWIVKHMGTIWPSPDYNMRDYSLLGSNDEANWSVIDRVLENGSPVTDRTFNPVGYRYVRVNVDKGLNVNNSIASIVELELHEVPPSSPYLASLDVKDAAGKTLELKPSFNKSTFEYNGSVVYSISRITVTPTAEEPKAYGNNAQIKVNGVLVPSGSSLTVDLKVGINNIVVEVTSAVGGLQETYKVNVIREANLYLTKVDLNYRGNRYSESSTVNMDHSQLNYTTNVSIRATQVIVKPVAEDPDVAIAVNDQTLPKGGSSSPIALSDTSTDIKIKVSYVGVAGSRDYTIRVNRT